jgi:type I restriction enzyme S subunit
MGWQRLRLDELGTVARGKSRHRPRNDPSLYGGNWPFFQTGDVKAAELYLRVFSQTYNDVGLAQSKLWPPDTLCITIAANIAETAILAIPGCFPDSIVGFRADADRSDVRYVKYLIDTLKLGMQNVSRGTTQDNLSLDKLLSFQMSVPSVVEQRRIASILSAYDGLIENNTRRIVILEEMARRIYEEWFVRFRFPGHELARMVESELGPVPEGWKIGTVADIADVYRGRSYKGSELAASGGWPFVNLKCIDRDGGYRASGLKHYTGAFNDSQAVRDGDLVMAVTDMTQERRIVARVARISQLGGETGVISMDLVRIAPPDDIPSAYLYAMFRWSGFADEVKQHANGANVLHLLPARIGEYRLAIPPAPLARQFGDVVAEMLHLGDVLETQNANLRTTRDLLLPKLISGELDVSVLPEPQAAAA